MPTTLDDWIRSEAIPFSPDSPESFNTAVDRLIAVLGDGVEILGIGEPMHGAEEFLIFRNRLFERLVAAHGYRAIAVESSFPRGRVINDYVTGSGAENYEDVAEAGFSHGLGKLAANRDLVEWMRAYNAEPRQRVKLHFYGFDSPTEMMYSDSPRLVLSLVLDYLASVSPALVAERHQRIEELLGQDAGWENTEANFDPIKSVGRSPAANALRIETEDLASELQIRRPELIAKSGQDRYLEALHYAAVARQLLTYHAAVAEATNDRLTRLLGIRDAMMADNLIHIGAREKGRGKVLAFAHNCHLKRGQAEWQMGPNSLAWWPAGSHLHHLLGPRYAVIGTGVGVSEAHGIGPPERGTLEARLTTAGPALFIPTHLGQGLPAAEIAVLPTRTGGKNASYFPWSAESLTDFDALALLH